MGQCDGEERCLGGGCVEGRSDGWLGMPCFISLYGCMNLLWLCCVDTFAHRDVEQADYGYPACGSQSDELLNSSTRVYPQDPEIILCMLNTGTRGTVGIDTF